MARSKTLYRAFNRGLVSPLALARSDIDRVNMSAETMVNWMPRKLGSMMLRCGGQYLGNTASNNASRGIPFVFSVSDTARIEITDALLRVWVSDAIVTRESVSAAITNGTFDSDLTGWTDDDAGTAVSQWLTGGYMELLGDGTSYAARTQEVTVTEANTAHGLAITIQRGPVLLRVGSTDGGGEYILDRVLGTGTHSFEFTPTGNFHIQFRNKLVRKVLVDSVAVESSGAMTITAPWAAADLSSIRHDQSGDVIYVACAKSTDNIGYQQYKIQRWATTSWSVVKYEPEDGPFRTINLTTTTITPSALTGDVTLTASDSIFDTAHVGALFRLASNGQSVTGTFSAENSFTDPIRVFGANNSRVFQYTVSGRTDSTITLQRSVTAEDSGFTDVLSITADTVTTYDDTLDNQVAWYRIGIKTGDYGTDTVTVSLDYTNGSIEGVVKITAYTSATSVAGIALSALGGTDATMDWYEGEWSDYRGWPSGVGFVEGRLGWGGKGKMHASVSDDFESFDDNVEGDSGPIKRSIGSGPVDTVNWMVELEQLLLGTDGREHVLRSSNENEILTPTNANLKAYGTQGSANVQAQKLDDAALFVQRGGVRLFAATVGPKFTYEASDLSVLNPTIGDPGIVRMAIQRQPDTRIHCVRSDGTAGVLVYDAAEEVTCWLNITTAPQSADTYTYASKSFSVQETDNIIRRLILNSDGTAGAVLGDQNNKAYDITLSTAEDISTASLSGASYSFGVSTMIDFGFSDDGTKMYVLSGSGGSETLAQYSISSATPYKASAATDDSKSFSLGAALSGATSVRAIWVNNAATRMYVGWLDSGGGDYISKFTFSTDGDVETLSLTQTKNVSSDISAVAVGGLLANSDETVIAVCSASPSFVHFFRMTTAQNLTTLIDTGGGIDTSGETVAPLGLFLNAAFTKAYVTETTNDSALQYNIDTNANAIEDVVVLPGASGSGEDAVYYQTKRTVNGSTVRFLERVALESECQGGTLNKQVDAYITGTVTGGTLTGLTHLEGENIVVWVNGADAGTYTVSGGQITGVTADGSAVAGLAYTAQYKSAKLGVLTEEKNIRQLALVLRNTHYQGLTYGPDFDNLDPLPPVEDGVATAADTVHSTYDESSFTFPGVWDTDARVCLQAASPRPCTILAAVIDVES